MMAWLNKYISLIFLLWSSFVIGAGKGVAIDPMIIMVKKKNKRGFVYSMILKKI